MAPLIFFVSGTLLQTIVIISLQLVYGVSTVSYLAIETLLNMETTFTITSLEENSVPVYRKDLPQDYVAYWQVVVNDIDFVIVSAGPKTGDYRKIYEGHLPTYTSRLDEQSELKCSKYFMLATDAIMMCEDVSGMIVATTHPQLLKFDRTSLTDTKLINDFLQYRLKDIETDFKLRAMDVDKKMIWKDVEFGQNSKISVEISIGETIKLPIITSARVIAAVGSSQHDVCTMTRICDDKNNTLVRRGIKRTGYGVKYLEFYVRRLGIRRPKPIMFMIEVPQKKIYLVQRNYFTRQVVKRRRRALITHQIPYIDDFPLYDQFKHMNCPVGCGPVAWAGVFAYLDRRAHKYKVKSQCKALYRNGIDGMSGLMAEVAPMKRDSRLNNYLIRLNKILGTVCILGGGSTTSGNMGEKIKSFYKSRVGKGKIELSYNSVKSSVAIYDPVYRKKAIGLLLRGYPAIIGRKMSPSILHQHYAVVLGYRKQSYVIKEKNSCKTIVNEDFNLNLGWGGKSDGWYIADAYMTVGAVM